jgi:hypothetical protein
MYVVTGFLLETAHHDDVIPGSGSPPAVASHTCGAHEIHIPLDSLHPCLACQQSSQRISTPALSFVPDGIRFLWMSAIPFRDEQFLSTDYLFSGKRGPPLS